MPAVPPLHAWDLSPAGAVTLQKRLRAEVRLEPPGSLENIRTVAGLDASFDRGDDRLYAGIVVLRLPDLVTVAEVGVVSRARFPYVPGLLSFRELPALLEAWEKLAEAPDAAMFDGQGIAHPRRFGIAAHAGLWLGCPSWGCAKSLLTGRYSPDALGPLRGSEAPLMDRTDTVGTALRTRDRTNPVFISAGHRIDLASAVSLTLRLGTGRYRLPEPARRAHLMVNALRRAEGKKETAETPDQSGSGSE